MNSNVFHTLVAAYNLILDPKQWTRDVSARNSKRFAVEARSEDAICWCASGAVRAVAPNPQSRKRAMIALNSAALNKFCDGVVQVNDKLGRKSVLGVFESVINA